MTNKQKWMIAAIFIAVGMFFGLISGHFPAWDGLPMRAGVILAIAFAMGGLLFTALFSHYVGRRFATVTYAGAVFAICIGFTTIVQAAEKPIPIHNPSWTWVTVKNPEGVSGGNNFHDFNTDCGIAEGGELQTIKTMGDKVLVKYTSPKGRGYGSECGNGAIFWMSREKYEHAEADYRKIVFDRNAEKDEIYRILQFGNHAPPNK